MGCVFKKTAILNIYNFFALVFVFTGFEIDITKFSSGNVAQFVRAPNSNCKVASSMPILLGKSLLRPWGKYLTLISLLAAVQLSR